MHNWKKISSSLSEYQLDAVLLSSPENRFYASGFHSSDGISVITKDAFYYFTDFRYSEAAKLAIPDASVVMVDKSRNYTAKINELIKKYNLKALGYEERRISVSSFKDYEKSLDATLLPCDNLLIKLRSKKEAREIEYIREAQRISERAFSDVLKIITPGMTERELAAEIICNCYKCGADKISFDPIVVSGVNSSYPHGEPTDKPIESMDFVTIDFGSMYKGYCSDMTRTIAIGGATEEMRNIYSIVLDAQTAGLHAARAGIPGSMLDKAAREVIDKAGFGKYFGHSLGHSLGIEIHEPPNAAPNEETIMPSGCVVTIEPGIYIPGKFGVRIEDMVLLTENGCENLTGVTHDLIII